MISLTSSSTGTFALIGLASVISLHVYKVIRNFQTFGCVPAFKPLISPHSLFSSLLPRLDFVNPFPGIAWQWADRKTAYFNHSHDLISIVPLLLGEPCFFSCSVDILRQVLGSDLKAHLTKPLDLTLDSLWGASVASASGDIWKRHRRIVGPAFNTKTYQLVQETASSLYQEMIEQEGWGEQQQVTLPSVNHYMIKFSLLTVARCAFGMPVTWASHASKEEEMSLIEAITTSSETIIAKIMCPDWLLKLPFKSFQKVDSAWTALGDFVISHVRRIGQDIDKNGINDNFEVRNADLLHRLIVSSEGDGKYKLSEKEMLSNIFTILFAGHETTANGMITTIGYLAIHQDVQEKAYVEVKSRLESGNQLDNLDSGDMPYLQACFQEAVRLFTPTLILARTLPEDFLVKIERPSPRIVVLPKGSRIAIDMVNTFRNPNIFENPDEFEPARWLGIPEADVGMFGNGPRACIGRKFASTEAISVLAHFLRDWNLDIDLPAGETRSQYQERVMVTGPYAGTISPIGDIPLKLTRRV